LLNDGVDRAAMMETLAELQKLRQQLHEVMGKLMHEAESEPGSIAALSYTRLASECQKLDRTIELLSQDLLKEHPHEGVA
jgi:hypothetical protein